MSDISSAFAKFVEVVADAFTKDYSKWWISDNDGHRILDSEVYDFLKQHTTWWGRLDPHYVSDCRGFSVDILLRGIKGPSSKWIFDFSQKAFDTTGGPFRRI